VCQTLSKNLICNYRTNTGRFDELVNIMPVKDEILDLIGKEKSPTKSIYIYMEQKINEKESETYEEKKMKKKIIKIQ